MVGKKSSSAPASLWKSSRLAMSTYAICPRARTHRAQCLRSLGQTWLHTQHSEDPPPAMDSVYDTCPEETAPQAE